MATLTARCYPAYWDLICPYCGHALEAPSGSTRWEAHELRGGSTMCSACEKTAKLPTSHYIRKSK